MHVQESNPVSPTFVITFVISPTPPPGHFSQYKLILLLQDLWEQPINFPFGEFGFDCPGGDCLHRDTSRGSSLSVFFRENLDSTVQEELVFSAIRLGVVAYQFSFERIRIRLSRRRLSPPRHVQGQQPISFLSRKFGFDCPGGARLHLDTSRDRAGITLRKTIATKIDINRTTRGRR